MAWLLNLRTRTKLTLAFALVVVGFTSLLFLAQYSLQSIQENDREISQLSHDLAGFKTIRFNLHDIRAAVLSAVLKKNHTNTKEMISRVRITTDQDSALLENLQTQSKNNPTLLALINDVTKIWREFAKVREEQILPLLAQGKFEDVRALAVGDQGERLVRLRALATRLDQQVEMQLRQLEVENNQLIDQQYNRVLLLGCSLILLAIGLTLALSHSIARPLQVLTRYAQRISVGDIPSEFEFTLRSDEVGGLSQAFARMGDYLKTLSTQAERLAQGDLSAHVAAQSEQDVLGRSFLRMVENLSQLTQEMQEGIVVIASASEEILTTAGKVAGGAQDSATSITEIATTIEEVKQTARMAHNRASEVNEASNRNRQIAVSGRDAVAQSLSTMTQVREQMHAMAESILRLGEQSQAISEIVATVNELAEQSNLLGVNASIEAGKAGDAGKGFAVVALEVKALAEQSKLATAQVRSILGDVQRAMTRAAMAAEQGSKAVELGFEHARTSDDAMRLLAESLEQSSDMAQQIATTSQQQLVGMDQVAIAINTLRQTSHDNAAGANQVDQSTRDLHGIGGRLKRLASQFKLPSRQTV